MAILSALYGGSTVKTVHRGTTSMTFGGGFNQITMAMPTGASPALSVLSFTARWGTSPPATADVTGSPGVSGAISNALVYFTVQAGLSTLPAFSIIVDWQIVEFN